MSPPDIFLALPFLPAGRGGLILILGGLSMLAAALFMLMVAPAGIPAGARSASGGIGRLAARTERGVVPEAPGELPAWHQALRLRATGLGLRDVTIQYTRPLTCVVVVGQCRTCRHGRQGCERERRRIQRSAKRLSRSATVDEICCRMRGEARCAFVVELRR